MSKQKELLNQERVSTIVMGDKSLSARVALALYYLHYEDGSIRLQRNWNDLYNEPWSFKKLHDISIWLSTSKYIYFTAYILRPHVGENEMVSLPVRDLYCPILTCQRCLT